MGASLLALANEIYMLLKDANILTLQFSYYESIAKLMLDIGNKTAAVNIPELFEEISNVHFYNTSSSSSNNFYTKPSWLFLQANSFSRIGVRVCNAMARFLRNLSKNSFKKKKLSKL